MHPKRLQSFRAFRLILSEHDIRSMLHMILTPTL